MRIVRTLAEMTALAPCSSVGFVPTMGALHEGHLSLMRAARSENERVVASLFVNPLQFGKNEDLSRYPRSEEQDFELSASVGVDVMFAPSVEELLPQSLTTVSVAGVSERWEGARRPGHFNGVATIVAKLFHIVQPHRAYFGLKDFQQCAVVKTMVRDLNFPIELRLLETVRDADGLALSSRNRYFSPEERRQAAAFPAILRACLASLATTPVDEALAAGVRQLEEAGFEVGYLAWVDADTLEPTTKLEKGRLIAAIRLANVWLIDNIGS